MTETEPRLDLAGVVDVHVHGAPDVIPRRHTDLELAQRAKAAGMSAIVLKSHHESTVGRAALACAAADFRVYGGLVLNRFVSGGLQPDVVEASLELGARIIWLPTLSSVAHTATFGHTNRLWTDPDREPPVTPDHLPPIHLEDSKARQALQRICQLVAREDAVLASGHVGEWEILLAGGLAQKARARFLVTHPEYRVPGLSPERQRAAAVALPQAFFERCSYVAFSAVEQPTMVGRIVEGIAATGGPSRNLISSDLGQPASPAYPDGLMAFGHALVGAGMAPDEVGTMMTDTPRTVLGLAH